MIRNAPVLYHLSKYNFSRCLEVVIRSGVVAMIEAVRAQSRGAGGRKPTGRRFTLTAILTVALAVFRVGRSPSSVEIYRGICTLNHDQLVAVGMDPQQAGPFSTREYKTFHARLTRLLEPLDPGADLPARRVRNSEHKAMLAARSDRQRHASEMAGVHLHDVVNAIIAGSVDERTPEGYQGDIVVDGTIVDLAKPSAGLGTTDNKSRGAAYLARYYVRDGSDYSLHTGFGDVIKVAKSGFGVEVTAVSRVGAPDDLYGVPPVVTAVAVHEPTSGSVDGFATAVSYHQANGFDVRRSRRSRLPYVTGDMGYNVKSGFNDTCLEHRYAPVARYPKNWGTVFASESELHTYRGVQAGPVQISGDFYCPMARALAGSVPLIRKTRDLRVEAVTRPEGTTGPGPFAAQDARIGELFPYLMGTNSRPYRRRSRPGRPGKAETTESQDGAGGVDSSVRQDLVCPAVQGRVRCPLKPASMTNPDPSVPTLDPPWPASRYRCCSQSQLTVPMSPEQFKRAQWGLVPGSWEHALYYEAARAATEQRFSLMKSQHITGVQDLGWAPKREPLVVVLIGLWVAATNLAIQESHGQGRLRPEPSTARQLRVLARDLGHEPTRIPART